MSLSVALLIVFAVGFAAFVAGRIRARRLGGAHVKVHSRPNYHGAWAALCATLPSLTFLALFAIGANAYVERDIASHVEAIDAPQGHVAITLVQRLADSLKALDGPLAVNPPSTLDELAPVLAQKNITLATDTSDAMISVAVESNALASRLGWIGGLATLALAMAGAVYGLRQIGVRTRARNKVERVVLGGLLSASTIAIMTTVGIVLSMLFQTLTFFGEVSPASFFFGTVWDPRFAAAGGDGSQGQFGLIPLLAGTLYIALIALLVAVPVGLMAAVYMSEYASKTVRSVVKPMLELLAGIPTIVYGIFALVTLGPWLRDISAALAGGTPFIQAQSILTAGLVMGVMLIPVMSSLSDDIITAVPQAMRDGSLGLGATRSETMKRVILPAALPGIVGAILLTASRAIGETMIVVLAAGVAARLTLSPFEAMTTITVKIVNQLTGDLEFNSPQTLVAFALGITLFFVTLVMNIAALAIVRKYREQYE